MRGLRICSALCALAIVAAGSSAARGETRDDTAVLQAKLDAGGNVFLPALSGGQCYETRGLWVSKDDTSITSNGACIVALGLGEARGPATPRPVRANAIFFLMHSDVRKPQPVRVTISGLRLMVPAGRRMAGIAIFGHETTVDHVTVSGAPTTDIVIGSGSEGNAVPSERNAIIDSNLSGGRRDVVSAFAPIGLRVEGNRLFSARGRTAAGLDIRAANRGAPALDVHVVGNTIVDNAGPGMVVGLDPKDGPPIIASGIEIRGNHVMRNARRAPKVSRAGIVLAGGELDGKGTLALTDNVVGGNRGPGILGRDFRFVLTSGGNLLRGNRAGATRGLRRLPPPSAPAAGTWTPGASVLATAGRDDTAWLQSRLDKQGGTIFLPKLPDGTCYATRGLWVSRDHTTITSNGACIVSLGPGAVRLHSTDGDPIPANAVFFVNRSRPTGPPVDGVAMSNLRIIVPDGQRMFGVVAFGHDTTLTHLDVGGSPIDDVLIGGRANGNGYVADVSVLDSTLTGADRNAISAFGVIGLRIDGNSIEGVRDIPRGQPAAGIDVEPDERSQPTLDVHITNNLISDNAGPGVLFPLETNDGPAMIASGLEIRANTILRNARQAGPPTRAGVAIEGGQDGGQGTLELRDNVIRDNGGPGILMRLLSLVVQQSGNDLAGNDG